MDVEGLQLGSGFALVRVVAVAVVVVAVVGEED